MTDVKFREIRCTINRESPNLRIVVRAFGNRCSDEEGEILFFTLATMTVKQYFVHLNNLVFEDCCPRSWHFIGFYSKSSLKYFHRHSWLLCRSSINFALSDDGNALFIFRFFSTPSRCKLSRISVRPPATLRRKRLNIAFLLHTSSLCKPPYGCRPTFRILIPLLPVKWCNHQLLQATNLLHPLLLSFSSSSFLSISCSSLFHSAHAHASQFTSSSPFVFSPCTTFMSSPSLSYHSNAQN